jgi:hypothetical protein
MGVLWSDSFYLDHFGQFIGCLRSEGMLITLIIDVEVWRGELMKGGELRTFLCLEDCVDMKIAT